MLYFRHLYFPCTTLTKLARLHPTEVMFQLLTCPDKTDVKTPSFLFSQLLQGFSGKFQESSDIKSCSVVLQFLDVLAVVRV